MLVHLIIMVKMRNGFVNNSLIISSMKVQLIGNGT